MPANWRRVGTEKAFPSAFPHLGKLYLSARPLKDGLRGGPGLLSPLVKWLDPTDDQSPWRQVEVTTRALHP